MVLIATADESARELTTRVFERAGYPSAAVLSGEEAVAAARKIRHLRLGTTHRPDRSRRRAPDRGR
jgi:CheY-like chemotaxis protein